MRAVTALMANAMIAIPPALCPGLHTIVLGRPGFPSFLGFFTLPFPTFVTDNCISEHKPRAHSVFPF